MKLNIAYCPGYEFCLIVGPTWASLITWELRGTLFFLVCLLFLSALQVFIFIPASYIFIAGNESHSS